MSHKSPSPFALHHLLNAPWFYLLLNLLTSDKSENSIGHWCVIFNTGDSQHYELFDPLSGYTRSKRRLFQRYLPFKVCANQHSFQPPDNSDCGLFWLIRKIELRMDSDLMPFYWHLNFQCLQIQMSQNLSLIIVQFLILTNFEQLILYL